MVRMDNLSAATVTSWFFVRSPNGFHWIYPASFIPPQGGGGMDRNPMADSIGIRWRNESYSGGAFNHIRVAACVGIPTIRKNLHFSARYHQQQVLEQLPVISQCILDFLAGLH
jgi:hypothetical protein